MTGARRVPRPLAVAVALAFYAGLGAVSIDAAFDDDARATVGTGGAASDTESAGDLVVAPGAAGDTSGTPLGGPATPGSSGGAGTSGPGSAGSGQGGATGGDPGQTSGTSPGGSGPGGPIRVGIRIGNQASVAAMGAALGTRGISGGNQRAYVEALVAHVNATGGIAGRPIDPDILEIDLAGLVANSEASDQADCEHFTDTDVFVVLSPFPLGAVLGPCLASRGIPLVVAAPEEFNANDLAALGGMMTLPGTLSLHRQAYVVIDALAAQGFYEGANLGFVWYDRPTFRTAVDEAFRPTFAAHGVQPEEFSMSSYTSSEQYASAVLRFKARGIDHVQFLDVSGLVALQFMQYAETQQFRPRYGLSSANSLSAIQTAVAPEQLRGAIGVGWIPSLDTIEHPGYSATAQTCLDALRAAGARAEDRVAVALSLWTCEVLSFFGAAMGAAPDHSVAGYLAGVAGLGGSYVPADTFSTFFGPGRFDGPATVRPLAYDDACPCFRYTGAPYAVG